MSPFIACLLPLICAAPSTGLPTSALGSLVALNAVEGWPGTWDGLIQGQPGLPLPAEGVPFRMILTQGETDLEGRLELAGQETPLTNLEVGDYELKGGVSLLGYAGTFRFELDADSLVGEFKTLFTVAATAERLKEREPADVAEREPSAELFQRLWQGTALATPYSVDLTPEEKVAGLSRVWSEVKFNFAYFDQVPDLDWDAEYLAALTRVLETESTSAYYLVLREFVAKLQDGHTNVFFPSQLVDEHLAEPPIKTLRVEGTVIVTAVSDADLMSQGLVPGLELIAIDGELTEEYAQMHVAPYVCSSTSQDRERQVYGSALLRGRAGSNLTLEVRTADEELREFTLERAPRRFTWRAPVEYEELGDGLGYLQIRSFQGGSVATSVDEAMKALAHTDGLIIDIRDNPGGNSGWWVMEYLVDEYETSAWATRKYLPAQRAWGRPEEWHRGEPRLLFGRSELYTGPVVLLTSSKTASAAEDLASVFKHTGRGTIIGQSTCGSTGQPLSFSLPGGGAARVCTKRDTYPDGSEWVGSGVRPDIRLEPTIADYRDGSDSILEAARAYLR